MVTLLVIVTLLVNVTVLVTVTFRSLEQRSQDPQQQFSNS